MRQRTLIKQVLLAPSLSAMPSSYHNAVIYGDRSLSGADPSFELFFGSCGGGKELFLIVLEFYCFLTQNNLQAKVSHFG